MQLTLNFVEITSFSSADSATIGLIVDPGGYKPCIDLFINGFFGLLSISFQLSWLIPYKNRFGSKDGEECIAINSPVKISITHIDPALSLRSSLH